MNFKFDGSNDQRRRSDPSTSLRLRNWVEDVFKPPVDSGVLITELKCDEEGCPPIETVIAILDTPGRPRQFKIHKPMIEVTREDIIRLVIDPQPHRHEVEDGGAEGDGRYRK